MDIKIGKAFPWATMTINITGAFILGVLATVMQRLDHHHPLRLVALVGFLGGYTTFSTFALEIVTLWEHGQPGRSVGYAVASVAGGVAAVIVGILLTRAAIGPVIQRPGTVGFARVEPGDAELAEEA